MDDLYLYEIIEWLEGLGHSVRIADSGLDSEILSGADALIMSSFHGPLSGIPELDIDGQNYLRTTIHTWFSEGGKFLWMSGDSDYENEWMVNNASAILGTVESSLRFEPAAVEDPYSNVAGAPYRVIANTSETVDPDGSMISSGVEAALFHGPTCIFGVDDEGYPVPLEEVNIPNAFNIYYTGGSGIIIDNRPPPDGNAPEAHEVGTSGHYVLMAGEKYLSYEKNCKVIASGSAPYGDYRPLWTPEYYGVPLDGQDLVKNAILWGLDIEREAAWDWNQALQALKTGELDALDQWRYEYDISELEGYPDISVDMTNGTWFRHFSMNCDQFPTNITGYRQALAYALDKYQILSDTSHGYGTPLDTVIPYSLEPWCMEGHVSEHYYHQDLITAIDILETSGFVDLDNDGWREYDTNDNGIWDPVFDIDDDELTIELLCHTGHSPSIHAVTILSECMAQIGLRGVITEAFWDVLVNRIFSGEFDLTCFTWVLDDIAPLHFLYSVFHSGQSLNFQQFTNEAYDAMADAMMESLTMEETRQYAWECQKILLEQMPIIVCYNDAVISAYRTDRWEGWNQMSARGVTGRNIHSYTHVHLKPEHGGPFGGELRIGLQGGLINTNPIVTDDQSADQFFSCIYNRLWQLDPYTLTPAPELAWDWKIEKTTTGVSIQEGMKVTFHLFPNATWHDERPVTAEDVKYSLMTIWPQSPYLDPNNWPVRDVSHIYRIDTPDEHTVIIYSNEKSYIQFLRSTYLYIFPKHIWEQHEPDFNAWEPGSWILPGLNDLSILLTGSGPFCFHLMSSETEIFLNKFENYHLGTGNPIWFRTYSPYQQPGWDWSYALVECTSGGFAIAGTSKSFSHSNDAWLIRTDDDGNHLWNKTYG
jgi:ABC-type transport system substrate-binding protein